jgi:hypothetical protein
MTFRSIAIMVAIIGCGGAPNPHDTSIAEHERVAQQHEVQAETAERRCSYGDAGPCWRAADNDVALHRKAAAQHRAASDALRQAEATACVGLSEDDRAMSPFEHHADIAGVEPFTHAITSNKTGTVQRQAGATVTFRAVPGLTAEWLQRLIDCHLARNAALGHEVPEMPNCPLVPRGVVAHVRSAGGGFAVDVESDDTATASEILDRARRL